MKGDGRGLLQGVEELISGGLDWMETAEVLDGKVDARNLESKAAGGQMGGGVEGEVTIVAIAERRNENLD